jgi:ABC-type uncharacterized transport system substrate-binding protein
MLLAIRKLSLGIGLVLACSAILLGWDYADFRASQKLPRVAILQHSSTPVLDDCVTGMIEALKANGFEDGKTIELTQFNAENDLADANAIARQVIDANYKLILTSSTMSLQVVATANAEGKVIHVFGAVADPYAAGVGLDPADPLKHPKHLVGLGSLMRVDDMFRIARKCFPDLKKVGVAHNPAEANSRVFMTMARAICKELNIELVDAPVENTAGVKEAVDSVITRGAQAIWIGGDVTVSTAMDSVLNSAKRAHIPVFSTLPTKTPDQGALFALGIDFIEVGKLTGNLAAELLRNPDTSKIAIRDVFDVVPKRFTFNVLALKGLRDPWRLPDDVRRQVDVLVDETGVHEKKAR